jgi:hypothetical protein
MMDFSEFNDLIEMNLAKNYFFLMGCLFMSRARKRVFECNEILNRSLIRIILLERSSQARGMWKVILRLESYS